MRLYDTHFHLDLQKNVKAAIEEISANKIYTIAMTNLPVLYEKEQKEYEDSYIRIALGFHPELIGEYKKYIPMMWEKLPNARYVGEVGLDFSDSTYKKEQLAFFEELIEKCREDKNKILSIHSRKAEIEVLNCLRGRISFKPILHWYTGNIKNIEDAVDIGCYFSINQKMMQTIKFKKMVEIIPLNRILLETDSPFGSNTQAHSNMLIQTTSMLANIFNMKKDDVEQTLWNNFQALLKKQYTMNVIKTSIDGVLILEPRLFRDVRGYFFESFSEREFEEKVAPILGHSVHFCQDNESMSSYGVMRGLHFQRPPYTQSKLVRCVKGRVLDVAVDIRKGSPTYGKHVAVELTEDNHVQFFIPKGFAHGFAVLSETAVFQYKCDNFYHPEADGGISILDKTLGIDWNIPTEHANLSEKDTKHAMLKDFDSPFDINVDLYQ